MIISVHRLISRRPRALLAVAALLLAVGGGAVAAGRQQTLAAEAPPDAVPLAIIMYHGILKEASRQGQYIISPALFEEDLQTIRQQGYTTVVMQDLLDYADGLRDLPEKPVMLTFDDGYYNNYLYAYPLLQKYVMKAVISPVVSWSEQYSEKDSDHAIYSHVTWEEMREMVASGLVEIQNHSYDMHYCKAGMRKGTLKRAAESTEDYQAALRRDLSLAQEHLTALVGVTPTTFTYPYGAMCPEALPVIEEIGFRATLTCESRVNRITRDPACLMGLGRYLRPSGTSAAAYFSRIFAAVESAG